MVNKCAEPGGCDDPTCLNCLVYESEWAKRKIAGLGPQGPIVFVPWFQQLDTEPLGALLKSGASVSLNKIADDFICCALWEVPHATTEINAVAATLDAALRDTCVMAVHQGLIK